MRKVDEMKTKKVTGVDYLWVALYACAVFAFELLLGAIEAALGIHPGTDITANIVHLIITTIGWTLLGFLVLWIGRKTTGFDVWEKRTGVTRRQVLFLIIALVVNIIIKAIAWGGFKPYMEYLHIGPALFIFQYIYYAAEGFVISIAVVYGQLAFEKWTGKENMPFGGIVLALVWGLMHILTKGSVADGLFATIGAILMGAAYTILEKDYRKTIPAVILMFML